MSHQGAKQFDAWHVQEPGKLLVATECCSCETQRGEDADLLPFRPSIKAPFVYASNENSACLKEQTQASNAVSWVGGTFVYVIMCLCWCVCISVCQYLPVGSCYCHKCHYFFSYSYISTAFPFYTALLCCQGGRCMTI